MQIPDLTQRIIGFRQWTVKDGELWPVATTDGGAWKPGPQHAECWIKHGGIRVACLPVVTGLCHCGWYALHDLEAATGYGGFGGGNTVQGIVSGWGRVAVHKSGFRSEWVELMAIIVPDDVKANTLHYELYKQVAINYNVPIMRYSQAEGYAGEWGAPVPESLRPKDDEDEQELYFDSCDELLQVYRKTAVDEARNLQPKTGNIPQWLVDVAMEIDPNCPEAMAGLYDIYVPNLGDTLMAIIEPPKPTYERFPEEEPYVPILGDVPFDKFSWFICTNGAVAYLPKELP